MPRNVLFGDDVRDFSHSMYLYCLWSSIKSLTFVTWTAAISKLNKTDHVEDYSIDTNTEICSTSDIETTKETRLKDSRVHNNHCIDFIIVGIDVIETL